MSRGPPPSFRDLEKLISLKVDNLPSNSRVEDLTELFAKFGSVADVYIPIDFRTRSPKSFGFVRFEKQAEADAAIEGLHDFEFNGARLGVSLALHPRRRSPRRRSPSPRRSSSRRSRSPYRSSRRSRSPYRSSRRSRSPYRSPPRMRRY